MSDLFRLPAIFGSHMLLQCDRPCPIWGWDRPGQRVVLTVEGTDLGAAAVAGADGRWRLECPPLPAGGPYRLRLRGSSERLLDDVLAGEVWLASGQSNMEWRLDLSDTPQAEWADDPELRLFQVAQATAEAPRDDLDGAWALCTPARARQFSAVAYHFGRELRAALGVPVGLILSAWGGTRVEAWASEAVLRPVMDVDAELAFYADSPAQRADAAAFAAAVLAWEAERLPADPGDRGSALGWARPDFDDSGWPAMDLPSFWQSCGLDHNGAVWFRRRVELPPAWAGRELELRLGPVDDFDHTFVNGVLVGSHPKGTPAAYTVSRSYRVPAELTQAGDLLIAVRVFDHFGQGGFAGRPDDLALALAGAAEPALPLAGPWRYQVELAIPTVPIDVFNSYPPRPPSLELQNRPAALFNAMVAPLVPCGLRGVIWYQGESNVERYPSYRERFTALIRDWRARWGQPRMPFLFVQLAGWQGGPGWPELRAAQTATLSEPATAMALAIDIGDPEDIHPRNKREVGRRLALLARARVYGEPVADSGPAVVRAVREGAQVRLTFDRGALRARDGAALAGFELAGADGAFAPAAAQIDGLDVLLSSARVPEPTLVRYAWAGFPHATLVAEDGLPAAPFRISLSA
jgi:sialate O-acetylesterase